MRKAIKRRSYSRIRCLLVSTNDMIRVPSSWFKIISEFAGTIENVMSLFSKITYTVRILIINTSSDIVSMDDWFELIDHISHHLVEWILHDTYELLFPRTKKRVTQCNAIIIIIRWKQYQSKGCPSSNSNSIQKVMYNINSRYDCRGFSSFHTFKDYNYNLCS